jgi:ferredoxin
MSRPVWFVDLIVKLFPTRFGLARLTHLPVIGYAIDGLFFEGDDLIYLPGDSSINKQIIAINQPLHTGKDFLIPSGVVEYFIQESDYHWIMDFCICRRGEECVDYPSELGCIFLGEAVKEINPAFGHQVTREEALAHAQLCRDAGLVHLIGRNKLDTIWLGAGPAHKLMTICNCCPCCCLWRFLPDISDDIGGKITSMPGVSLQVNELCSGCGTCVENTCFVDAIHLENGRAVISSACRGCGRCVDVCQNNAIELIIEDRRFVEETIDRIAPLVDLR